MRLPRGRSAVWTMILALGVACGACFPSIARENPATPEVSTLTLERVIELLRAGIPSPNIITLIERQGGDFHLAIDDVVRLRKIGASARLVLLMATGPPVPGPPPGAASSGEAEGGAEGKMVAGKLTTRDIRRALGKGADPAGVVRRIETEGMRRVPELDELADLAVRGVPPEVIRAMARGGLASPAAPAAASASGEKTATAAHPAGPLTGPAAGAASGSPAEKGSGAPLDVPGILALVRAGDQDLAAEEIRDRGVARPPSLDEVLQLRAAGANDDVMAAVQEASADPGTAVSRAAIMQESEAPEVIPGPEDAGRTAVPWKPSPRSPSHVPSDSAEDRLWVASVPSGQRVFLATSRTRPEEVLEHGHYVGRTPQSLTIPAGDYLVVVQHDAGEFEDGLAPAWRTVHDGASSRSLLDNADLTFDPNHCCLPGSLRGEAELRPLPRDNPRALIGDSFDGLPPYLFDGEMLQVLRVRDTRITHAMKMYRVRKSAGLSRILVSTFVPSEGDPLDQNEVHGLPPGTPYDRYVDAPALDFLGDPAQLADAAAALGVETEHLEEAVAMLRRAGKAILHQQVEGGFRLLTLSVEDEGRVRLTDQTIRPEDLFAPPPEPPKKKKKAKPIPPAPPLPVPERVVMPGLGLPRLTIENGSGHPLALLLDDGQLCWVPAGVKREFTVDPGSHDARVLGPGFSDMKPAPIGRLHFSYNARYTITF